MLPREIAGPGGGWTCGVGILRPARAIDADAKGLAKRGRPHPLAARAMARRKATKSVDAGPLQEGRLLPNDRAKLSEAARGGKPAKRDRRGAAPGNVAAPSFEAPAVLAETRRPLLCK
jgi:hypothetical protein